MHRVIWKGLWHCLEHHTSGLVTVESIQDLGSSFISKRRQVLLKIAGFHVGCNLFASELLFYCMDFSQIWFHWKAIFEENPASYVTKGKDYSLWKTSAITEIAPPDHSGDIGSYQIRTSPIWMFPLMPGMFSFHFALLEVVFGMDPR